MRAITLCRSSAGGVFFLMTSMMSRPSPIAWTMSGAADSATMTLISPAALVLALIFLPLSAVLNLVSMAAALFFQVSSMVFSNVPLRLVRAPLIMTLAPFTSSASHVFTAAESAFSSSLPPFEALSSRPFLCFSALFRRFSSVDRKTSLNCFSLSALSFFMPACHSTFIRSSMALPSWVLVSRSTSMTCFRSRSWTTKSWAPP